MTDTTWYYSSVNCGSSGKRPGQGLIGSMYAAALVVSREETKTER